MEVVAEAEEATVLPDLAPEESFPPAAAVGCPACVVLGRETDTAVVGWDTVTRVSGREIFTCVCGREMGVFVVGRDTCTAVVGRVTAVLVVGRETVTCVDGVAATAAPPAQSTNKQICKKRFISRLIFL